MAICPMCITRQVHDCTVVLTKMVRESNTKLSEMRILLRAAQDALHQGDSVYCSPLKNEHGTICVQIDEALKQ